MQSHTNSDLVLLALQFYGTKAVPGAQSNPLVIGFFQQSDHREIKDDDTPWCSAFLNSIARMCNAPSTGSLAAQSWLKVGKPVESGQFGDVVIFERGAEGSGLGHVGLVVAQYPGLIYVLGGNQSNMVDIAGMPTDRILGFRRLL